MKLGAFLPALRSVNGVDAVALDTLEERMKELFKKGVTVHIAGMKGPVRDLAAKAGWYETFGGRVAHLSIKGALEAVGATPPAQTATQTSTRKRLSGKLIKEKA